MKIAEVKYNNEDVFELFEEDIDIIRQHEWLNDRIMNFFMIYYINRVQSSELRKSIGFIPASIAYLLCFLGEDDNFVKSLGADLKLQDKRIIFVPVNNSTESDSEVVDNGGDHWSLLVVTKRRADGPPSFFHFDSFVPVNRERANILAGSINKIFMLNGAEHVNNCSDNETRCSKHEAGESPHTANNNNNHHMQMTPENSSDDGNYMCDNNMVHHVRNVPQQDNSIDCGLFAIEFCKKILSAIKKNALDDKFELNLLGMFENAVFSKMPHKRVILANMYVRENDVEEGEEAAERECNEG